MSKKNKSRLRKFADPDLMERTRATVTYLNGSRGRKDEEMYAFLSLFHPNMSHVQKRALSNPS